MYTPIVNRVAARAAFQNSRLVVLKRGFASTKAARAPYHPPHFEDGAYHNLPFKVHGRKIPFVIPFSLFFIVPFLTPFGMAWLAM
ncbi:hypothetical protein V1514DRAFT_339390 [Lipomyces japonicus]|uniref:uncharacterized protein n=1 Tax=Lipomyces japonicus TaxID=56871 RepID=UPI0034CE7C73